MIVKTVADNSFRWQCVIVLGANVGQIQHETELVLAFSRKLSRN